VEEQQGAVLPEVEGQRRVALGAALVEERLGAALA